MRVVCRTGTSMIEPCNTVWALCVPGHDRVDDLGSGRPAAEVEGCGERLRRGDARLHQLARVLRACEQHGRLRGRRRRRVRDGQRRVPQRLRDRLSRDRRHELGEALQFCPVPELVQPPQRCPVERVERGRGVPPDDRVAHGARGRRPEIGEVVVEAEAGAAGRVVRRGELIERFVARPLPQPGATRGSTPGAVWTRSSARSAGGCHWRGASRSRRSSRRSIPGVCGARHP